MKTFVLIMLFGANTATNGPAVIDGFVTKKACEAAGDKIMSTFEGGFTPNSTQLLEARYECVEIAKK
mgnify:CR=1 FL=1